VVFLRLIVTLSSKIPFNAVEHTLSLKENMIGLIRIAKNSTLVLIARATDVFSSLFIAGILARYLGVEDYGNYLFIIGLVLTTTSFAHLGLPQILVREMSQTRGLTGKLIQTGLLLTGVSFLLSTSIALSIGVFSNWTSVMFIAVSVALFSELMSLLSGPFVSAFISFEKMQYDALATIFNRVIMIGLVIGVVSRDLGFVSVFASITAANSVRLLIVLYISKRIKIKLDDAVTRQDFVYLLKETLPIGISLILIQVYLYTNLFVLKMLKDPAEVALFQAPFSIVLKLQVLPTLFIVVFEPVMARMAASETFADLKFVYMYILKYLFIFSLPIAWVGVLLAKDITTCIFGDGFLPASISFQISIWMVVFQFLNIFSDMVLQVISKQRYLIISSGVVLLCNIAFSFALIGQYGYVGGSIAALMSAIILFGLNFYFVSRYLKNVSLAFMIKPLLAFLVMVIFACALTGTNVLLIVFLGLTLYAGILFKCNMFSKTEFELLSNAINKFEPRRIT